MWWGTGLNCIGVVGLAAFGIARQARRRAELDKTERAYERQIADRPQRYPDERTRPAMQAERYDREQLTAAGFAAERAKAQLACVTAIKQSAHQAAILATAQPAVAYQHAANTQQAIANSFQRPPPIICSTLNNTTTCGWGNGPEGNR